MPRRVPWQPCRASFVHLGVLDGLHSLERPRAWSDGEAQEDRAWNSWNSGGIPRSDLKPLSSWVPYAVSQLSSGRVFVWMTLFARVCIGEVVMVVLRFSDFFLETLRQTTVSKSFVGKLWASIIRRDDWNFAQAIHLYGLEQKGIMNVSWCSTLGSCMSASLSCCLKHLFFLVPSWSVLDCCSQLLGYEAMGLAVLTCLCHPVFVPLPPTNATSVASWLLCTAGPWLVLVFNGHFLAWVQSCCPSFVILSSALLPESCSPRRIHEGGGLVFALLIRACPPPLHQTHLSWFLLFFPFYFVSFFLLIGLAYYYWFSSPFF